MKLIIAPDFADLSKQAAEIVIQKITDKPRLNLGLATGNSMIGVYEQLIIAQQTGRISFAQVKTFNLDEFAGLPGAHRDSLRQFMEDKLFSHIDLPADNIFFLNGVAPDLSVECVEFEQKIQASGGIDLQLLGIGLDGHLGFNEPGESFDSRAHKVALNQLSRQSSYGFNIEKLSMPEALTVGLATIMEARALLLLASGASKAEIIAKALRGVITTEVPGSIVQNHKDLTVVVDKEAAIGL